MAPKLVLITGGATGIGRAVAERSAAHGDRVVVVGRDSARLEATAHEIDGVEWRSCDVRDEAAVTDLIASLEPVDVLVANAGTATAAPIGRTSLKQWESEHAANATGVFLCARAVLPAMCSRGDGRVIVVASIAGLAGANHVASYTASKHAAVGLVRALAVELARTGVTVNAVCPSFVDTPMTERAIDEIVSVTERSADDARRLLEQQSPLGRLLDPSEVAGAVDYLASPEAGCITGHCLVLGGPTLSV